MSDVSYYDADLIDAIVSLEDTLKKISKLSGPEKKRMIYGSDKQIKLINDLKNGYSLALKQMGNKQDSKVYRDKLEQHSQKIEELLRDIKWAKSEFERSKLTDGAAASGNETTLASAVQLQEKTQKSLENTRRLINESKQTAASTAEKLEDQGRQMGNISDNVMKMNDSLTRAEKLIRTFSRRMATDRVILFFAFLVFLGIAGIILYATLQPDQSTFYVPDEVRPPNPGDIKLLRHH